MPKNCISCVKELPLHANFCRYCGINQNEEVEVEIVEEIFPQEKIKSKDEDITLPTKSGSKSGALAMVIIIVLMAIVLGVLVYQRMHIVDSAESHNDSKTQSKVTPNKKIKKEETQKNKAPTAPSIKEFDLNEKFYLYRQNQEIYYPLEARKNNLQGVAKVRVNFDSNGSPTTSIFFSTRYKILDDTALDAVNDFLKNTDISVDEVANNFYILTVNFALE